jgi:copper transport protein
VRPARRLAAVLTLAAPAAALAVALAATPAAAHATLLGSDPRDGATLERAPASVKLTFSEPVSLSLGGVRMLTAGGGEVRLGRVVPTGDPSRVEVALPPDLHGVYVLSWRAVSADSHPVAGAFTFTVGSDVRVSEADRDALLQAAAGGSGGADRAVTAAAAVTRAALFAALTVLLGALAFLVLLWPDGVRSPRVRALLLAGLVTAAAATLAGVPLQGAYATGRPLTSVLDPSLSGQVLTTRFGLASAARLALLLVVAAGLARARRAGSLLQVAPRLLSPRQAALTGLAVAAGLLATVALVGHAGTGPYRQLGLATDLVHLAAVSAWLGGLAVLAVAVLPGGPGPEDPGIVVGAFSQLAFTAVATIVGTGVVQSVRQVREVADLTTTSYGRLLLVKVALVAGMLALAAASRRVVRRQLLPGLPWSRGRPAPAPTGSTPSASRWRGCAAGGVRGGGRGRDHGRHVRAGQRRPADLGGERRRVAGPCALGPAAGGPEHRRRRPDPGPCGQQPAARHRAWRRRPVGRGRRADRRAAPAGQAAGATPRPARQGRPQPLHRPGSDDPGRGRLAAHAQRPDRRDPGGAGDDERDRALTSRAGPCRDAVASALPDAAVRGLVALKVGLGAGVLAAALLRVRRPDLARAPAPILLSAASKALTAAGIQPPACERAPEPEPEPERTSSLVRGVPPPP